MHNAKKVYRIAIITGKYNFYPNYARTGNIYPIAYCDDNNQLNVT